MERKFFKGLPYFDPCPLHSTFNGLEVEWKERNYVNPPYDKTMKELFIMKAYKEWKENKKMSVLLIPATTETKIFHNIIVPNTKIILIKERIKFKGHNTKGEYVENKSGQTGSMFVIFGQAPCITTLNLNGGKTR